MLTTMLPSASAARPLPPIQIPPRVPARSVIPNRDLVERVGSVANDVAVIRVDVIISAERDVDDAVGKQESRRAALPGPLATWVG